MQKRLNKELIKRNKEVFDYWVNGGTILVYDSGNWIQLVEDTDAWATYHDEAKLVINDKYVEFRKAEVEGKVIQYKLYNTTKFKDCKTTDQVFKQNSAELYRIKPEEPEFKIGDWLYYPQSKEVFQYTKDMLYPNIGLWQPTEGEFVVMYNTDVESPFYEVVKYNKFSETTKLHYSEYGNSYTHVAPLEFIQTLENNDEKS